MDALVQLPDNRHGLARYTRTPAGHRGFDCIPNSKAHSLAPDAETRLGPDCYETGDTTFSIWRSRAAPVGPLTASRQLASATR
jgi:hypothetical protein